MFTYKLQVFFRLLTPTTIIEITVKNQDVPKRQNFLVFWYHVSFVWLTAPSTLLIERKLREKHQDTCKINVLTYNVQPAPPQIKDRVFFVLLEGDWGEGTRKRAVTDGKGAHAHCSICKPRTDFSKAPYF